MKQIQRKERYKKAAYNGSDFEISGSDQGGEKAKGNEEKRSLREKRAMVRRIRELVGELEEAMEELALLT